MATREDQPMSNSCSGEFMDLSTVVVAWADEHPASKQEEGKT